MSLCPHSPLSLSLSSLSSCSSPSASASASPSASRSPSPSSSSSPYYFPCTRTEVEFDVSRSHFHPGDSCFVSGSNMPIQLAMHDKFRFFWQSEAKDPAAAGQSSSAHRGSKPCSLSLPMFGISINIKFLGKGSVANKAKDQAEQTNQARMIEFQRSQDVNSGAAPVLVKLPPAYVADKFASVTLTSLSPADAPIVLRVVFALDSHHQRQSIWVREDYVNAPHPQPLLQLAVDTPFIAECWVSEAAREAINRCQAEVMRFHDLHFESSVGDAGDRKSRRKRKSTDRAAQHLQAIKLEVHQSQKESTPAVASAVQQTTQRIVNKKARKTPDATLAAPLRIPESITEEDIQNLIDSQEGKAKLPAKWAAILASIGPGQVKFEIKTDNEASKPLEASIANKPSISEFKFSSEVEEFDTSIADSSAAKFRSPSHAAAFLQNSEATADVFSVYSDYSSSLPLSGVSPAAECTLSSLCGCSSCSPSLHRSTSADSFSASSSLLHASEQSDDRGVLESSLYHSHREFSFSQSERGEFEGEEHSINSCAGFDDEDRDFESTNSNSSTYSLTFQHFSKFNIHPQLDSDGSAVSSLGFDSPPALSLPVPMLLNMKSETEFNHFDAFNLPSSSSSLVHYSLSSA